MTRAEYDVLIRNVAMAFSYANFGMALAYGIVKKGVAMSNKDDRSDTSDLEDRSSTESSANHCRTKAHGKILRRQRHVFWGLASFLQ
jgi:hypothetical protein